MTVKKDLKGYISTDVYKKDTDTHNYLQRNSAHPEHCKKSIPYSQFLRLKRIISDPEILKRRLKEYIEYFVNSGYSRKSLEKTVNEILNPSTPNTVKTKTTGENSVRFITSYNKTLPDAKNMMKRHWTMLNTNEKCRDVYKMKPQIVYKRSKNLSDILVRAKYRKDKANPVCKEVKTVSRCSSCSWCNKMTEGTYFKSFTTGKKYKIFHEMTCTTPWVIYLCRCKVHKKQYIGKSETKLNIRMNNNRNHLRIKDRSCKLIQHFIDSTSCKLEEDLEIMPIEQITMDTTDETTLQKKKQILKTREIFWQKTLKTMIPEGLNKRVG